MAANRNTTSLGPSAGWRGPAWGVFVPVLAIALIGWLDYITGVEIVLSIFYILPVAGAAWWLGRGPALIAAVAAAVVQFAVDYGLQSHLPVPVLIWNDGSRFVIYLAAAILVNRLYLERVRLRERDRQREEFISVFESELRRPASAMEGTLATLEAELPGPVTPVRDALRALRHYAQDVAFLAGDFLAIGNLQAGRPPVHLRDIDIRQLVRDSIRESRDAGRVALVSSADALMIRGDEDRLRHALSSVIAVALDAPNVDVNLHLRESDTEVVLELHARVTINDSDVQLARLLWEANGGSFTVTSTALASGTVVRMRLPRIGRAQPL